jgi:hypothetical protein
MMFFLLGLGGWNKDVNLYMGLLLSLAGRATGGTRSTHLSVPSCLWLLMIVVVREIRRRLLLGGNQ